LHARLLAARGLGDGLGDRPLGVGERVGRVVGGEVPDQRLEAFLDELGDLLLDLMLHRGRAVGAEVGRDLLREPVLELAEGAPQRAAFSREGALELTLNLLDDAARLLNQLASGLARGALELRAHVIDVLGRP
jgi:hypothetical protein